MQLCQDWQGEIYQPDGSLVVRGDPGRTRLLNHGISFSDLDYKEISAACVGLTQVLLLPGLNTVIEDDHLFLWAWVAEVLVSSRSGFFDESEMEIKNLCAACMRAALVSSSEPASGHVFELVRHAHLTLAYLVFPLLEAVLKKVCHMYVDYSGQVVQNFTVHNSDGSPKYYATTGRRRRCNSVRDLLFLLYDTVAEPELKDNLTKMRDHVSNVTGAADAFDLIYNWRNSSLHGETNFQTIGGTLLCLIDLIAINHMRDTYDRVRPIVLRRIPREMDWLRTTGYRGPENFYPPRLVSV